MKDTTNIFTPIAKRLLFLDGFCNELIERVRANNEHELRIAEIRNIQTAIRAACSEVESDSAYFDEAVIVFTNMKKRLARIESDPEYLGLHEHAK